MEGVTVSRTALLMSYLRGYHSLNDPAPIFDDDLAYSLLPEEERAAFDGQFTIPIQTIQAMDPAFAGSGPDRKAILAWTIRTFLPLPLVVSRARHAEDALARAVGQGVGQYVILGAGLDTFAFRRPDVAGRLRVFEVDHPVMHAYKRRRLAEVGWEVPGHVHLLPVDLARESLEAVLARSRYDRTVPTFFSWLGVTMYLTRDEVFSTLRAIAGMAPAGSAVVFDYLDTDAFVAERAARRVRQGMEYTRRQGEPMKTGLDPDALAADLAPVGLRLTENLGPADIEERYFRRRGDGYHAYEHAHVARAVVERGP
jgi:methyltransferase (TIGR00027 family)